jgi:hypothetical protein
LNRVDLPQMKGVSSSDGQNLLIVSLNRTDAGISGDGRRRPSSARSRFEGARWDTPTLEPQNVERETGTIRVVAPEAIEIAVDEKGLEGAQPSRDVALPTQPARLIPASPRPGPTRAAP